MKMHQNIIVIDDFLDHPDKVRQSVLDNEDKVAWGEGHYSGIRTSVTDEKYQQMIVDKIQSVLPFKIEMDMNTSTFSFQMCIESDDAWCHQDDTDYSAVLYLTPHAPIDSGTLFFKQESLPDPDSDEYGDYIIDHIGNVYNRLVIFNGKDIPHRANIPGFGDSLKNCRLTQHFFFNRVK